MTLPDEPAPVDGPGFARTFARWSPVTVWALGVAAFPFFLAGLTRGVHGVPSVTALQTAGLALAAGAAGPLVRGHAKEALVALIAGTFAAGCALAEGPDAWGVLPWAAALGATLGGLFAGRGAAEALPRWAACAVASGAAAVHLATSAAPLAPRALIHALVFGVLFGALWRPAALALLGQRRAHLEARGLGRTRGDRWASDLGTTFGAGLAPKGPGTLGAFAALPLGWGLTLLPLPIHGALLVAGTFGSLWVARRYVAARRGGVADPQEIVLDESIGVLIALFFVPWTPLWVAAAFVLFRVLDMTKPGPVGWIDRQHTPDAVMLDDVAAGLLAGVALLAVRVALG